MYANLYDKDPKRFYEIKIDDDETKSRIEQKGKREYLLCENCESKFSLYEKYADDNLYGKNNNGEAILVKQSMTPNQRTFLYEFENFNYSKMKLFLDSLLWRLLICDSIETPSYDERIIEKLRLSLHNEVPLEPTELPCLLQSLMTSPGRILQGFILSPLEMKNQDRTMLSIIIDGMAFTYYMSKDLPNDPINPILQKDGKLKVLGVLIFDLPIIMNKIKILMNHLNDRLNK